MFALQILLVLASATVLASYWAWRAAFYNPIPRREDPYKIPGGPQYQRNAERMLALVREFDAIPYEPVEIRSFDGLRLFGRYYHVKDGAPLQIQFHGYRGTALRDFCGGNKLVREAGINTLVVDQRAHGSSEGHAITMGVKERTDCLAWAEYALERFGPETPVTLAGVSMGAATVLMASQLDLPENVKGIMADCPFSAPRDIVLHVLRRASPLAVAAYPLLDLGTRLFGGFRLTGATALEAVKEAKVPLLIIHGEDDHFVPCDMSRDLAQAAGDRATLATFPGAGHGLSYIEDAPRYKQLVTDFLNSVHAAR